MRVLASGDAGLRAVLRSLFRVDCIFFFPWRIDLVLSALELLPVAGPAIFLAMLRMLMARRHFIFSSCGTVGGLQSASARHPLPTPPLGISAFAHVSDALCGGGKGGGIASGIFRDAWMNGLGRRLRGCVDAPRRPQSQLWRISDNKRFLLQSQIRSLPSWIFSLGAANRPRTM